MDSEQNILQPRISQSQSQKFDLFEPMIRELYQDLPTWKHQSCILDDVELDRHKANYDSLRKARDISCFPLAIQETVKKLQLKLSISKSSDKLVSELSKWQCQNFSIEELIDFQKSIIAQLKSLDSSDLFKEFLITLNQERVEHMGLASFYAKHWEVKQPIILVSQPIAEQWEQSLKLLGVGSTQMIQLAVDDSLRLDIDSANRVLEVTLNKSIPILMLISTVAINDEQTKLQQSDLEKIRDHYKSEGLYIYLYEDSYNDN